MNRLLMLSLLATLALAGPASAATVAVTKVTTNDPCGTTNNVSFTAGPGEVNKLTLVQADVEINGGIGFPGPCFYFYHRETTAVVSDPGAPLTAGAGCSSLTRAQAACSVASAMDTLAPATIDLGNRADALALSLGTPAAVDAGPGNDQLRTLNGETDTVDCGGGFDTITADAADQLTACESVTRL
jgi:hypothetical protein